MAKVPHSVTSLVHIGEQQTTSVEFRFLDVRRRWRRRQKMTQTTEHHTATSNNNLLTHEESVSRVVHANYHENLISRNFPPEQKNCYLISMKG